MVAHLVLLVLFPVRFLENSLRLEIIALAAVARTAVETTFAPWLSDFLFHVPSAYETNDHDFSSVINEE